MRPSLTYSQESFVSGECQSGELTGRVDQDRLLSCLDCLEDHLIVQGVTHPALLLVPHEVIVHSAESIVAVEHTWGDDTGGALVIFTILGRLKLDVKDRCGISEVIIGKPALTLCLYVLHRLLLSPRVLIAAVVKSKPARADRRVVIVGGSAKPYGFEWRHNKGTFL